MIKVNDEGFFLSFFFVHPAVHLSPFLIHLSSGIVRCIYGYIFYFVYARNALPYVEVYVLLTHLVIITPV